ncbi:MAG: MmcQ/YjbR family DNA-binding protein [Ruminococcus sp.]|nr:MmcQ/YjbR family DNA-binding protein [Ruminococcus sp.]
MKGMDTAGMMRFVKKQYGTEPEYLWMRDPDSFVLRHKSGKWYAVVMKVKRSRLGLKGEGFTEIMSVKCDPLLREGLLGEPGVLPAYHMNRQGWISVLLDGSAEEDIVCGSIKMSYELTKPKGGRNRTEPKKWIIPSNPKICDLEDIFDENGEIMWTFSAHFIKGDTVYIYICAPESEIRYECRVIETGIDFDFGTDLISTNSAVRLKLIRRFPRGEFTVALLRELGVTGIRGPRGIPPQLAALLEAAE